MATVDSVDVQDMREAAENAGFAPHTVDIVASVYFAVCSGDVPVPWSEDQIEGAFICWDAAAIIDLLMLHPEFIKVAVDYHNFHG